MGLHYLGSLQNQGGLKLSKGLLAKARSNILGVQEVPDRMKLNCLYDMVICTYNITDYHWLPYTVHLLENGAWITMYDDSNGGRNFDKLRQDWADVFATQSINLHIVKRPSQKDGSSCGPRTLLCMICVAFRHRDGNESGDAPSKVDWWDDGQTDAGIDKIVRAFRTAMIRVFHHLLVNYEHKKSGDTVDEESISHATSQQDSMMSNADSVVNSNSVDVDLHRITLGSQGSSSQESVEWLDEVKVNLAKGKGKAEYTDILAEESSGDSQLSVGGAAGKGTTKAVVATSAAAALMPKKRPRQEELNGKQKKKKETLTPSSSPRGTTGSGKMKMPVSFGKRAGQRKQQNRPYDIRGFSLKINSGGKHKGK